LHFDALDQNALDLIGFPVVGLCSTPAASLHPSSTFVILQSQSQESAHTPRMQNIFGFRQPRSKSFGFDSLNAKSLGFHWPRWAWFMHDPSLDRRSLPSRPAPSTSSLPNFIHPSSNFIPPQLHHIPSASSLSSQRHLYPHPLMHYSLALDAASSTFFQNFPLEVPTRIPDSRGCRIKGKLQSFASGQTNIQSGVCQTNHTLDTSSLLDFITHTLSTTLSLHNPWL
jgi:hypothetical protein